MDECAKRVRDQWVLVDEVSRVVETGEWLEEYG